MFLDFYLKKNFKAVSNNKMPSKLLKKKESREDGVPIPNNGTPQIVTEDQRKSVIPLWAEWSDQDISNEKWNLSKKEKGRSSSAQVNYFDDPDGKVQLPPLMNPRIKLWKRPSDILMGKTAVIVDPDCDHFGDLILRNEHIVQDEVINEIISSISIVSSFFSQMPESESSNSSLKLKSSLVKEQNNSKTEKIKKENEFKEEHFFNPWDLIWPKESSKSFNLPAINLSGKYAVKLFWMGTQRKIIVDDTIPCDQNSLPLLPFTSKGNELWLPILTKAILKVASLHYYSENGKYLQDFHVIYCLLGWLPELIPISKKHEEGIWQLMLHNLRNWKLPPPSVVIEHATPDEKVSSDEVQAKQLLSNKASKEKSAKSKDEKKLKGIDKDAKTQKERSVTSNQPVTKVDEMPVIIFACISPFDVLDQNKSFLEKYKFHSSLVHQVYISNVRNCPLLPSPASVSIPQWRLIRKKKEPKDVFQSQVKEPKFLQLKSPFFKIRESINNSSVWNLSKTVQHDSFEKINLHESLVDSNIIKYTNTGSFEGSSDSIDKGFFSKKTNSDPHKSSLKENSPMSLSTSIPVTYPLPSKVNKVDLGTEVWMEFDEFLKCFSTLLVFHKPKLYFKTASETKIFDVKSEKESSNFNSIEQLTCLVSNRMSCSDISSPYLVIDSLKQTEIVICFQSFTQWFEPNFPVEGVFKNQCISAGNLQVTPYHWQELIKKQAVLKISTIGIKSVTLAVPPGRHVFQLLFYAQLGFNVTICSSDSFSLCDERSLIQHFSKESAQLIDYSLQTVKQLKTFFQSFDECLRSKPIFLLGTESQSNKIRRDHFQLSYFLFLVFNKSLAKVLEQHLNENFSPKIVFALSALRFKLFLHLQKFQKPIKFHTTSLNHSVVENEDTGSEAAEVNDKKISKTLKIMNLKPTSEEISAVKIQACFKGFYIRKLFKACKPGTKECDLVADDLKKLWSQIESYIEPIAVKVTHEIFQSNSSLLLPLFPFQSNEWNKVICMDYSVSYSEQAIHSAFVISRELFKVKEDVFISAKVFSNIPQCLLRIINNDDHKEIKSCFGKVMPQVLAVNELGYTFVVMVKKNDFVIPAGKLTLRILGETEPLPLPSKEGFINSSLTTIDFKEYYIPNLYKRIFRYTLNVTMAILASIQLITSKDDAIIHLKILDNTEELYTCKGKGYVDIPSFMFFKDHLPQNNELLNASSQLRSGSVGQPVKGLPFKEHLSKQTTLKQSVNIDEEDTLQDQVHSYVIEAFVLNDSWPLTKAQWTFVDRLKSKDEPEDEDVIEIKDNPGKRSVGKNRKSNNKESKNKQRPDSQNKNILDLSKPHWVLRLVVDSNMEQAIKVKKDTERESQIRATKYAWESANSGRSSKALQSRVKHMQSIRVKLEQMKIEEKAKQLIKSEKAFSNVLLTGTVDESIELFNEPPAKNDEINLISFDLKPFIRTSDKVNFSNFEMESNQVGSIKRFRESRSIVLLKREFDRLGRNAEKERQLIENASLQLQVDARRTELIRPLEAHYRSFLPISETELGVKKIPSSKQKLKAKALKK